MQAVHIALMMGVVLFLGIVLYLYASSEAPARKPTADNGTDLLTVINLILVLGTSLMRMILPATAFRNALKNLPRDLEEQPFAAAIHPGLLSRHIMNMALLEGSIMFSLVVILIHAARLHHEPWLWINLIPALIGIALMTVTFPSASRYAASISEAYARYLGQKA